MTGPAWLRLQEQIEWYDAESKRAMAVYKCLKVLQIVVAASIPVVAGVGVSPWVTGGLGSTIVVVEGIQQLYRFHEYWLSYRAACEALRHELFLYEAKAGSYRILHLATHAILNDTSPMYSHVLLSQGGTDSNEDGLLEAWEVMKLNLQADMVVLSACETARGRIGAGEGVIGLTWALFVAGAPATVVSQWKVESASTTELMVEFHRQLQAKRQDGKPRATKAEALRQAAIKLLRRKQSQHPFYWAAFVVVGDGG